MPQLFRYERQQKGRLREHFQLNVDIIGEADVTADAELLARRDRDHARAAGSTSSDVRARVSDRRLLQRVSCARSACGEAQLPAVFGVIDKLERQPRDVSREKLARAGVPATSIDRCSSRIGDVDARRDRARFARRAGVAERVAEIRRYFALSRRARRASSG